MKLSKKCQYALRAIFELVSHHSEDPVKTHIIAKAQGVPLRFMENILNELKHGGFVESRRGNEGGYALARDAHNLTVAEVIEYIQGPISVAPDGAKVTGNVPHFGDNAFTELWIEINNAVSEVCGGKTFADLVESERAKRNTCLPNYNI